MVWELYLIISLILINLGLLLLNLEIIRRIYIQTETIEGDLFNNMGELREGLNIVAAILQKLPDMTPQFQINQSPIMQLLEFFSQNKPQTDPSYTDAQLRDDSGRFSDGEKEEENAA